VNVWVFVIGKEEVLTVDSSSGDHIWATQNDLQRGNELRVEEQLFYARLELCVSSNGQRWVTENIGSSFYTLFDLQTCVPQGFTELEVFCFFLTAFTGLLSSHEKWNIPLGGGILCGSAA